MSNISHNTSVNIFVARNNHSATCGKPPNIDASQPGRYYGYFENEHKEQFIFVYDRDTKQGTVWVGDNGWEKPIPITDVQKPDVVLSKSEWLWLQSCWMAATAFEEK